MFLSLLVPALASVGSPDLSQTKFEPTWESLQQYKVPEWYRDAKFGIWAHWGPQSVPMEGDWYARHMYEEGSPVYKTHIEKYGHPSQHGYVEIINQWKAEEWNPNRLMKLYKEAGAKFFVSMGVHHDNFDLWDSSFHRWNAVKMGPHKDVVGIWQKAAKKHGLKFGVSEHLGASFTWWRGSKGADTKGPLKGVPYDGNNPDLQDLYHPLPDESDTEWYSKNRQWQSEWYLRVNDLLQKYNPDLLYSDGEVPFGKYGLQTIANLYNQNPNAIYLAKLHEASAYVEDRERGSAKDIMPNPWQTDTSIGDWFYNKGWTYRKADWVLKTLVDVSSKNGALLLNVVQRPDGGIDPEVEVLLKDLAEWMRVNSESVFGTRPWMSYGEGPTRTIGGHFREDFPFSEKDVRYVQKGQHTLYATFLGVMSDREVTLKYLKTRESGVATIRSVQLVGDQKPLAFTQTNEGLKLNIPKNNSKILTVLKITCGDVREFDQPKPEEFVPKTYELKANTITLDPAEATLTDALGYEQRDEKNNLAFWFSESATASWKLKVDRQTPVRVSSAWANLENSNLTLLFKGKKHSFEMSKLLPATGDWGRFRSESFGELDLPEDIYTVTAAPAVGKWKPINLRGLEIEKK